MRSEMSPRLALASEITHYVLYTYYCWYSVYPTVRHHLTARPREQQGRGFHGWYAGEGFCLLVSPNLLHDKANIRRMSELLSPQTQQRWAERPVTRFRLINTAPYLAIIHPISPLTAPPIAIAPGILADAPSQFHPAPGGSPPCGARRSHSKLRKGPETRRFRR